MTAVADALEQFRRQPSPPEGAPNNPFKLVSTFDEPIAGQVEAAWESRELPVDALDLWAGCGEAQLFKDVEYGQWGLVLLSPPASATRTKQERNDRPSELRPDDVVLGEFIGDSELLLIAPSETDERRILIALPIYHRADWFGAAPDLGSFLTKYFDSTADKYWER